MGELQKYPPGAENFTFGHKIPKEQKDSAIFDLSQTDFNREAKKALEDLNREKGILLSKANLSSKEQVKLSEIDDQISMFKNARQKGTIASA